MRNVFILAAFGIGVNLLAWAGLAWDAASDQATQELLNVSYDPTRELWRDLNAAFVAELRAETRASSSRSASRTAAPAARPGRSSTACEADVVTLALWSDTDAIRKKGLIDDGWEERLPNRSLPYISTIVFVVRKGNPKGIKDWPDLVRDDVEVITPNPKTSGNGKLSFLAAWGAVVHARRHARTRPDEFVTRAVPPRAGARHRRPAARRRRSPRRASATST